MCATKYQSAIIWLRRLLPVVCIFAAAHFAWASRDELLNIRFTADLVLTILCSLLSLIFSLVGASVICGCPPLRALYIFALTQLGNYVPSGLVGQISRVSLIHAHMKVENPNVDLSTTRTTLAVLGVLASSGASLLVSFVLVSNLTLNSTYIVLLVGLCVPLLAQILFVVGSLILPLVNRIKPGAAPDLKPLSLRCFLYTTMALFLLGVSFSIFVGEGFNVRTSLGYSSAWFGGFLAFFSPNGLGVREWMVGQLDIGSEGVVVAHRLLVLASEVLLWLFAACLSRTQLVWRLRPR